MTNGFAKGTTVYTCKCCGHKTRTIHDRSAWFTGNCEDCYELAGIENAFCDGNGEQYKEEAEYLIGSILKKGGNCTHAIWSDIPKEYFPA